MRDAARCSATQSHCEAFDSDLFQRIRITPRRQFIDIPKDDYHPERISANPQDLTPHSDEAAPEHDP